MLSTIFSRRLRRSAAVLVAAGAILTGGVAAAEAVEPPPAPDTPAEATPTDDPSAVEPQIIGGGEASQTYSFMATLGFVHQDGENTSDLGHQCGASLVFRTWVLTAAHCVADPPEGLTAAEQDELSARFGMDLYDHVPSEGSFYVKIGSKDRTDGAHADVTQIVVHEDFNWFENSLPTTR